ncbi:hypothetical protein MPER_11668 [Moniliophthora perniciosa FA553]|nr:hypothetical protein MPER_11668 [Moniliophthora perniciosa FA553]
MEEAIYHVAEAHILVDWKVVGKVESLSELQKKSPQALRDLAETIVRQHASTDALTAMEARGDHRDEAKAQTIMWNRDALQYIVLDEAIKHGDVGMMEAMLPTLLFRFIGGQNSNYTIEVLELLQGLYREWTDEVKEFVRKHCWLVNFAANPDTYVAIDQAQEHNVKDIKVTYNPGGPNIDWAYLKKLHPALPVIVALCRHMEHQFQTYTRGKKHTVPKKDADVDMLCRVYEQSAYHKYVPGRTITSKGDKAADFYREGQAKFIRGIVIQTWHQNRYFERSTEEEWNSEGESGEKVTASGGNLDSQPIEASQANEKVPDGESTSVPPHEARPGQTVMEMDLVEGSSILCETDIEGQNGGTMVSDGMGTHLGAVVGLMSNMDDVVDIPDSEKAAWKELDELLR